MENKTKRKERPESEQVARAGHHPEDPVWLPLTYIISHWQEMVGLSELSAGDKGAECLVTTELVWVYLNHSQHPRNWPLTATELSH